MGKGSERRPENLAAIKAAAWPPESPHVRGASSAGKDPRPQDTPRPDSQPWLRDEKCQRAMRSLDARLRPVEGDDYDLPSFAQLVVDAARAASPSPAGGEPAFDDDRKVLEAIRAVGRAAMAHGDVLHVPLSVANVLFDAAYNARNASPGFGQSAAEILRRSHEQMRPQIERELAGLDVPAEIMDMRLDSAALSPAGGEPDAEHKHRWSTFGPGGPLVTAVTVCLDCGLLSDAARRTPAGTEEPHG